ncbi:MAG: hypothetical protein VX223_11800, partial [Myxococcota bacterium]|nr:hypothetical protein [Myxococcota bacterium]
NADLLLEDSILATESHAFEKVNTQSSPIAYPEDGVELLVHALPEGLTGDTSWAISTGLPLPKGSVFDIDGFYLEETGPDGVTSTIPAQFIERGRWHRLLGSLRWVGVEFRARWDDINGTPTPRSYRIMHTTEPVDAPSGSVSYAWLDDAGTSCSPELVSCQWLRLENGIIRVEVKRTGFAGVERAWLDANGDGFFGADELVVNGPGGPYFTDEFGVLRASRFDTEPEFQIEDAGPNSVTIKAEGWYRAEDPAQAPLHRYISRITLKDGDAQVRVSHRTVFTENDTDATPQVDDMGWSTMLVEANSAHLGGDGALQTYALDSATEFFAHQYTDSAFRVVQSNDSNATPSVTGARLDGSFGATSNTVGATLVLRDVWQRFPRQFGLYPSSNGMDLAVHFWPKHGTTPFGTDEDPPEAQIGATVREVTKLRFAHQGDLLTFRMSDAERDVLTCTHGILCPDCDLECVSTSANCFKCPACAKPNACTEAEIANQPAACARCEYLLGENYYNNPDLGWINAEEANLKTATRAGGRGNQLGGEFSLLLHHPEAINTGPVEQLTQLWQTNPHALPDPKWSANSDVEGRFAAQNVEAYPVIETTLDTAGPFYLNTIIEGFGEFGTFMYGSVHDGIDPERLVPSFKRSAQNSHYRNVFTAWLQYFRSGSTSSWRWAHVHSDHFADVGTNAWGKDSTAPSDVNVPNLNPARSIYSRHAYSPLPWTSGASWNVHWSDATNFELRYYLTGDRRFHDLFIGWGKTASFKPYSKQAMRRDNVTPIGELVSYYQATFDPHALTVIRQLIGYVNDTDWDDNDNAVAFATYNTRWLERYLSLTRDPEVTSRLFALRDAGYSRYSLNALAYWLSGDVSHLQPLRSLAYDEATRVYDNPGDDRHGFSPFFKNPARWYLQEMPYFLRALQDAQAANPDTDLSPSPSDTDGSTQRLLNDGTAPPYPSASFPSTKTGESACFGLPICPHLAHVTDSGSYLTRGSIPDGENNARKGTVVLALEASDQPVTYSFEVDNGFGAAPHFLIQPAGGAVFGQRHTGIEDSPLWQHTQATDLQTGIHGIRITLMERGELLAPITNLPEVQVLFKQVLVNGSPTTTRYDSMGRKYWWLMPETPGDVTLRIEAGLGKKADDPAAGLPNYVRISSGMTDPPTVFFETTLLATASNLAHRSALITLPADQAPWLFYATGQYGPYITVIGEEEATTAGVPLNPERVLAARTRNQLETVTSTLFAQGCPTDASDGLCDDIQPGAECGYVNDGCGSTRRCAGPDNVSCADPENQRCIDFQCVAAPPCSLLSGMAPTVVDGTGPENIWIGTGEGQLVFYNGTDCTLQDTGVTLDGIRTLHAVADNLVFVAGTQGDTSTILQYDDNGWQEVVSNEPGIISDLSATASGDTLWATKNTNTSIHSMSSSDFPCIASATTPCLQPQALAYNDPPGADGTITPIAIWATSNADLWVGGAVKRPTAASASFGPLLHLLQDTETVYGGQRNVTTVRHIDGANANDVWMVGTFTGRSEPQVFHWNGANLTSPTTGLDSVHFATVAALGNGEAVAAGPVGIWRYDGASWQREPVDINPVINWRHIYASSPSDIWVVGEQWWRDQGNSLVTRGVVYHFDGQSWSIR